MLSIEEEFVQYSTYLFVNNNKNPQFKLGEKLIRPAFTSKMGLFGQTKSKDPKEQVG